MQNIILAMIFYLIFDHNASPLGPLICRLNSILSYLNFVATFEWKLLVMPLRASYTAESGLAGSCHSGDRLCCLHDTAESSSPISRTTELINQLCSKEVLKNLTFILQWPGHHGIRIVQRYVRISRQIIRNPEEIDWKYKLMSKISWQTPLKTSVAEPMICIHY